MTENKRLSPTVTGQMNKEKIAVIRAYINRGRPLTRFVKCIKDCTDVKLLEGLRLSLLNHLCKKPEYLYKEGCVENARHYSDIKQDLFEILKFFTKKELHDDWVINYSDLFGIPVKRMLDKTCKVGYIRGNSSERWARIYDLQKAGILFIELPRLTSL